MIVIPHFGIRRLIVVPELKLYALQSSCMALHGSSNVGIVSMALSDSARLSLLMGTCGAFSLLLLLLSLHEQSRPQHQTPVMTSPRIRIPVLPHYYQCGQNLYECLKNTCISQQWCRPNASTRLDPSDSSPSSQIRRHGSCGPRLCEISKRSALRRSRPGALGC